MKINEILVLFFFFEIGLQANSEFSRCVLTECQDVANKCFPQCLNDQAYINVNGNALRCLRNKDKRVTMPSFDLESYLICLTNIVQETENQDLKTWLNCEIHCHQGIGKHLMFWLPILIIINY